MIQQAQRATAHASQAGKHRAGEHAFNIDIYLQDLQEQNRYAAELRKTLPSFVFKPVPQRLWWLAVHAVIIAACVTAILIADPWYADLFFSLVMGHSMGCLFFIGHEIAHGTVVKNKRLIVLLTSACFATWGLHGMAWISWHNRKHHHETNHPFRDPDCFGKKYQRHQLMLRLEGALPGSGRWISYAFLFWFFSFFSFNIVWFMPRIFVNRQDKLVSRVYSVVVYAVWLALAIFAQPYGFVYLMLVPILISNFLIMSYIATNHFLNPLTETANDPLANSLTVTTNRLFDFLHLNFSYHTEHHVVPYVSPKYAPMVAKALRERYPHKYKAMPHARALQLLYARPRFYQDDVTLINLRTGEVYPTIVLDEFMA